MRRTFATVHVALAATVALVLSGCGGGTATSAPVTLRIVVQTGDSTIKATLQGIADQFVKDNPQVAKVQIDTTPSGQAYRTVITTQIGGGDPPDVGWLGDADSADFIAGGGLADLASTLRSYPGYQFDDLNLSAMSGWTRGDAIYGVPFSTSPSVVFYNADLFKAAGVPTPDQMIADGTWTWEGLAGAAKTIAAKTGKPGYVNSNYKFDNSWAFLSQTWYPYGAQPWSADGKTCEFTSQQMVSAMTLLHSMIYGDKSMPAPGVSVDFAAGQAAMASTFLSYSKVVSTAKFTWGVAPLPSGPAGAKASVGQSAFVAFAASKHRDLAAKLVAALTTTSSEQKLAKWYPPIRKSVLTVDTLKSLGLPLNDAQLQSVLLDQVADGVLEPVHADMGDIQPAVRAALEGMWKPTADIPATMAQVCQALSPLLGKAS